MTLAMSRFRKKFWGFMSGLLIKARVPNLKFVSLAVLELLAFNAEKFTGSNLFDAVELAVVYSLQYR